MGTLNVLNAISSLNQKCTGIFITTDKVYKNNEWTYGYRENDELVDMIPTVVVKRHVNSLSLRGDLALQILRRKARILVLQVLEQVMLWVAEIGQKIE